MRKPLFSIIVPAYNEEEGIARTIESLKSQTFRDFEIIVIDNNSRDRTKAIAKSLTKRVYSEKKQGYMSAANAGVRRALGEYISIADADSIYPPDWLGKAAAKISRNPRIAGIYGSCRFYDNNFLVNFLSAPAFSVFLIFSRLIGHHNTAGFNFIMSKKAYIKCGGYDPGHFNSVGADLELGLRISKLGPMALDTSMVVQTSSRRFKKNGLAGTVFLFLEAWFRLHFNLAQKVDYSTYNVSRR